MSKNSSNSSKKSGNTKQISCAKRWCFTVNNYNDNDINDIVKIGSSNKYIYGLEVAPTTGTKHIQGYIEFNEKIRPKNLFSNQTIHWEKAKGSREQNIEYCKKGGDFFTNFILSEEIIVSEPYGWQLNVVNVITSPINNRLIYWFWENKGNVGKTSLCKYLCVRHNALLVTGKGTDMKYGIISYIAKHGWAPKIIIIDVPRSIDTDYVSYTGIEEIKNGIFFNNKYESDMCIFNSPHLIVFSNEEPNKDKLSNDRWRIICIDDLIQD